jgi:hypothetical protein
VSEPSRDRAYSTIVVVERVSGCLGWVQNYVMVPLIFIMMLVGGSVEMVSNWAAHAGQGTHGTFMAVREECGHGACTWYGDFVGNDGQDVRHDVWMESPLLHQAGDRVPALDTGASGQLFAPTGDSSWEQDALILAGGALLAALWAYRVPYRAWRRRRVARVAFTSTPAE